MPTKITVFFQSKTFAHKSATFEDPPTHVNNEQLLINEIHRIWLQHLTKLQEVKKHTALMILKKPNYAKRFEILSSERAPYPWQESEYRWKNRRSSELRVRNWRKR